MGNGDGGMHSLPFLSPQSYEFHDCAALSLSLPVTPSRIFPFLHSKSAGGAASMAVQKSKEGRELPKSRKKECSCAHTLLELQGDFCKLKRYLTLAP